MGLCMGFAMGRVRTWATKRSARKIVEAYYTQLTLDFQTNKRVVDEIAETPSKRMRNKIAGFVTHLMKRIQRGPVRGISLKLQEEERERRLDFVPDRSALEKDSIPVDADTYAMLDHLGVNIPTITPEQRSNNNRRNNNRRDNNRNNNYSS